MRHLGRTAGWLVGGLSVVALGASLVAVGFYHRALERSEGEVAALRRAVVRQADAEAERSARDRGLLEQLGRELVRSSAEQARATEHAEAQAEVVAVQQGRIEQVGAERDTAVELAAEQAWLLADHRAALEETTREQSLSLIHI